MAQQQAHQDHDSPWKEALEQRFPDFMALLFPAIHAEVDWPRGHEFLDKELQQVTPDATNGRRYADKLAKVYTREGEETWVLIHVEVQGEPQANFAARMYTYHYRLLDRYGVDVVSLAVLADTDTGFRPERYQHGRWGCELDFCFPMVKLLDLNERWEALVSSDNVFALVVMAQLKAKLATNATERRHWKTHLVRLMYQRHYQKPEILQLFRLIDWMIRLPRELEREFLEDHYAFEEARKMTYVTSAERFGIEKGMEKGIEQGIEKGLEEGLEKGREEGRTETARNLIQFTQLDDATISKTTGLDEGKVRKLRESLLSEP